MLKVRKLIMMSRGEFSRDENKYSELSERRRSTSTE